MLRLLSRLAQHPGANALSAQALGVALAYVFILIAPEMRSHPWSLVAIQGGGAAIASHHLGAPRWWQLIHLLFAPAALAGLYLALPPWVWLAGFVSLFLVFGRTYRNRVPLYLSNRETGNALLSLLPAHPAYVLDIGCGDGALLRHLALARPDSEFVGIEHAVLPYCWARARCAGLANVHIRWGDFARQPLTPFDLVYAFLSPAPMPALWARTATEMRAGTWLISNSFAVPGVAVERLVKVPDRRGTELYCYRIDAA